LQTKLVRLSVAKQLLFFVIIIIIIISFISGAEPIGTQTQDKAKARTHTISIKKRRKMLKTHCPPKK